jgi:hypothetical protein
MIRCLSILNLFHMKLMKVNSNLKSIPIKELERHKELALL